MITKEVFRSALIVSERVTLSPLSPIMPPHTILKSTHVLCCLTSDPSIVAWRMDRVSPWETNRMEAPECLASRS